jgi:hypothetical protein
MGVRVMTAQFVEELMERDDLLDVLNEVVRAMLGRTYPGAEYATLVVHLKDGVPDLRIPVIPTAAASAGPAGRPRLRLAPA